MPANAEICLAASSACLNLLHLADDVAAMKNAGVDELWFAISDGDAGPLHGGLDVLRHAAALNLLPCHAVLFMRYPERHLNACADAGCAGMCFSLEPSRHAHRLLESIRAKGLTSGIVLNPYTSLVAADYVLDCADRVCLLGVEPGAHRAVASNALVERVKMLQENIRYRELRTEIFLHAGIAQPLAEQALAAGARGIVLDPMLADELGAPLTKQAAAKLKRNTDPETDAV